VSERNLNLEAAVVQKVQEPRTLWEYGKGEAFSIFPQYGGGRVMTKGPVRQGKQTIGFIPDISILR
jgi:hypothetical protein